MTQLELFGTERSARDAAIDLIKGYVSRGDTLEQLKASQMGFGDADESACIGGYCQGKKFSTDFIIVSKFQGQEICEVFKLKEIHRPFAQGACMTNREKSEQATERMYKRLQAKEDRERHEYTMSQREYVREKLRGIKGKKGGK